MPENETKHHAVATKGDEKFFIMKISFKVRENVGKAPHDDNNGRLPIMKQIVNSFWEINVYVCSALIMYKEKRGHA